MNLEKVVFGFFVVLAATLNFGFFIGDISDHELHNPFELFASLRRSDSVREGVVPHGEGSPGVVLRPLPRAAWHSVVGSVSPDRVVRARRGFGRYTIRGVGRADVGRAG